MNVSSAQCCLMGAACVTMSNDDEVDAPRGKESTYHTSTCGINNNVICTREYRGLERRVKSRTRTTYQYIRIYVSEYQVEEDRKIGSRNQSSTASSDVSHRDHILTLRRGSCARDVRIYLLAENEIRN